MLRRAISFLKGAGPVKTKVLKFHSVFDQRFISQRKDNCTLICFSGTFKHINAFQQRKIADDSRSKVNTVSEKETSRSSINLQDDDNRETNTLQENISSESYSNYALVYMRGLPYSVTNDDIMKFFSPLGIVPTKVTLKHDRYGFTNGKAEVEFENAEESSKALQKRNHYIGHRYIEISLTPFPQMNADRSGFQNQGTEDPQNPFIKNSKRHVVKLSGLPFSANPNDVYKFFEPLNIQPIAVELKQTPDGFPVGICFVTFKTEAEAAEALKNNNKYIGDRYVRIFRVGSSQGQRQYSKTIYEDKISF